MKKSKHKSWLFLILIISLIKLIKYMCFTFLLAFFILETSSNHSNNRIGQTTGSKKHLNLQMIVSVFFCQKLYNVKLCYALILELVLILKQIQVSICAREVKFFNTIDNLA